MQKTITKCSMCGQPTMDIDICDNCGTEIDHDVHVFSDYVTVRRTNPEGEEIWDFEFCNFNCLVEWMNKRTIANPENPSYSPYDWTREIRQKFKIHS